MSKEDFVSKVKNALINMDAYDYLMIMLFLVTLFSRIILSPHCLWIDEARELFITRNFLRTGQFTFFGEQYMQHPYMFYLLIAAAFIALGMKDAAGQIVVILLGSLIIPLIYLTGKELFNKKLGLIAAALIMSHPLFWFYSERILNDVPLLFFLTLSLYLYARSYARKENKTLYMCGVTTAMALLTKMSGVAILAVFFTHALITDKLKVFTRKKYWVTLIIFTLVFSTWMIRNYLVVGYLFPLELFIGRLTPGVHELDVEPIHYYLVNFMQFFQPPLTLLFLVGLLIMVLLRKLKKISLLLLWFVFFLALMSLQTVKVPRYILPLLPAVVLIAAIPLDVLFWVKELRKYAFLTIPTIIIALLLINHHHLNMAVPTIQRMSTGFCGLKETGEFIKQTTPKTANVMAMSNTQIHWYSDRNVVTFPSTEEDFLNYLRAGNITYLEIDDIERSSPAYIKSGGLHPFNNVIVRIPDVVFNNFDAFQLVWTYSREFNGKKQAMISIYKVNTTALQRNSTTKKMNNNIY